MTTIAATTSGAAEAASAASAGKTADKALSASEMGDRFLKLLVTQLKNQDPLNPMDNAQLTSQMAQINTVSGIEKLNDSVKNLGSQFLQAQAMQGAAMIGRQAWVEGDRLVAADGVARGGLALERAADAVSVQVIGPGGRVLDTLDLGAQAAGRASFQWNVAAGVDPGSLRFKVVAKAGSADLPAQTYSVDTVTAVSTGANGLRLGLASLGDTDFSAVKAVSGSDRNAAPRTPS
ncbi:MAG: flagellar basal-body rod modification protein FlgD [Pseudomonadota bacterium]|jgi:flagellar basal-body rod modification protein FlgD